MHDTNLVYIIMIETRPDVIPAGLYNAAKAIKELKVSKATFFRMVKNGKIKFGIRQSTNEKVYLGSELLRVWEEQVKI